MRLKLARNLQVAAPCVFRTNNPWYCLHIRAQQWIMSAANLFLAKSLFMKLLQSHPHTFVIFFFRLFLEVFFADFYSKAKFVALECWYHQTWAIILWYKGSCTIRSNPRWLCHVILLKDGLVTIKNNKGLIHLYMYTQMATELCFFIHVIFE